MTAARVQARVGVDKEGVDTLETGDVLQIVEALDIRVEGGVEVVGQAPGQIGAGFGGLRVLLVDPRRAAFRREVETLALDPLVAEAEAKDRRMSRLAMRSFS